MGLFDFVGDAISDVGGFFKDKVLDDFLGIELKGPGQGGFLDSTLLGQLLDAAQAPGQYGIPRRPKSEASKIKGAADAPPLGQLPGNVGLSQNTMGGLSDFLPMYMAAAKDDKDSVLKRLLDDSILS